MLRVFQMTLLTRICAWLNTNWVYVTHGSKWSKYNQHLARDIKFSTTLCVSILWNHNIRQGLHIIESNTIIIYKLITNLWFLQLKLQLMLWKSKMTLLIGIFAFLKLDCKYAEHDSKLSKQKQLLILSKHDDWPTM